jgi:hypothetical protein
MNARVRAGWIEAAPPAEATGETDEAGEAE